MKKSQLKSKQFKFNILYLGISLFFMIALFITALGLNGNSMLGMLFFGCCVVLTLFETLLYTEDM